MMIILQFTYHVNDLLSIDINFYLNWSIMKLFGFLENASTGILLGAVDRASKAIKESESFRYFSNGDTKMINDYRQFECTMVGSAMAFILLNLDLKNSSHKKDIQTIYIGKSADFIRKILSKEYKLPELALNEEKAKFLFKGNMEALLCFELHVKFERYLASIEMALKENSPFYFWKYSTPEIDEMTGEERLGEDRLHDFVWHILLAEERPDFEDYENESNYIGVKMYMELNDMENQLLFTFIDDLKKIN